LGRQLLLWVIYAQTVVPLHLQHQQHPLPLIAYQSAAIVSTFGSVFRGKTGKTLTYRIAQTHLLESNLMNSKASLLKHLSRWQESWPKQKCESFAYFLAFTDAQEEIPCGNFAGQSVFEVCFERRCLLAVLLVFPQLYLLLLLLPFVHSKFPWRRSQFS